MKKWVFGTLHLAHLQRFTAIQNYSNYIEDCEVGGTTNPYGTSKYMVNARFLRDTAKGKTGT